MPIPERRCKRLMAIGRLAQELVKQVDPGLEESAFNLAVRRVDKWFDYRDCSCPQCAALQELRENTQELDHSY